jgi:nucleoside-diphosphate kinase
MKLCQPGLKKFEQHYEEHKGKPFFSRITKWANQGAVLAMVWEGTNVILTGRKLIGATSELDRNPGSIRGDISLTTQNSIIHGSDSVESANREIALWFTEQE